MNNNMKIIFYGANNGDIHYSRQFVKDIIKKKGNSYDYYYSHNNSIELLCDMKNITSIKDNRDYIYSIDGILINDDIHINTWIGQQDAKYLTKGITLESNLILYNYIYDKLGITLDENILNYIPRINYKNIEKSNIDLYLKNNKQKNILICNGYVHSGQSKNFDFNWIIDHISDEYPNFNYITTDNIDVIKSNVFLTKDIIKKNDCDLNEISYLSLYCDLIIGRSSGPYAFCDVYDNLFNEKKIFINISEIQNWHNEFKCSVIKTADYNNILNIIKDTIKKIDIV